WTERHIVLLMDKQISRGSSAPARRPARGLRDPPGITRDMSWQAGHRFQGVAGKIFGTRRNLLPPA
ncbi:hypothetical protein, partial [Paracoccus denitrificans]|uniref:hypothetical protein n=1 Tax=Paracoccus denitrificans TaxID=266 RepID=UPI001C98FAE1